MSLVTRILTLGPTPTPYSTPVEDLPAQDPLGRTLSELFTTFGGLLWLFVVGCAIFYWAYHSFAVVKRPLRFVGALLVFVLVLFVMLVLGQVFSALGTPGWFLHQTADPLSPFVVFLVFVIFWVIILVVAILTRHVFWIVVSLVAIVALILMLLFADNALSGAWKVLCIIMLTLSVVIISLSTIFPIVPLVLAHNVVHSGARALPWIIFAFLALVFVVIVSGGFMGLTAIVDAVFD